MFNNLVGKILLILSMASFVLLLFLLNNTTPATAGPLGVLAVFLCLYIIILSFISFILYYSQHLIRWVAKFFYLKKPIKQLSWQRSYYHSSVVALGPIILLGLGTVGKIEFYEIVLVLIFIILGCFYIAKRS